MTQLFHILFGIWIVLLIAIAMSVIQYGKDSPSLALLLKGLFGLSTLFLSTITIGYIYDYAVCDPESDWFCTTESDLYLPALAAASLVCGVAAAQNRHWGLAALISTAPFPLVWISVSLLT